jgi:hypothetical protein
MRNRGSTEKSGIENLSAIFLGPTLVADISASEVNDCINAFEWRKIYCSGARIPRDFISGNNGTSD